MDEKMLKKAKNGSRIKMAVAAAILSLALATGGCSKSVKETEPPKVEIIASDKKGDFARIFNVKSSYTKGNTFYSLNNEEGGSALLTMIRGTDVRLYDLGKPEGKSAVIDADDNYIYILYDGTSTLKRFELKSQQLSETDLGFKAKNPSIAVGTGKVYISSDGLNYITILDMVAGTRRGVDISMLLNNESKERFENGTVQVLKHTVAFTAKDFTHVYMLKELPDGKVEIYYDDLYDVIANCGSLITPRVMVHGRELCVRPDNGQIAYCMIEGGKVTKKVIVKE